jgi:hypothetical protein
MYMLQRPNTLQPDPVLKPYNPIAISTQPLHKSPIYKVLNDLPALICHISCDIIRGNRRLRPNHNVSGIWSETIWPIIEEDLVVRCVVEGSGGVVFERWWAPGKAVLQDVVGHASILAIDLVGPGHVTTEVGWLALESFECILSYIRNESAKLQQSRQGRRVEDLNHVKEILEVKVEVLAQL